ncbi:hypothetical protein BST61_g11502 [Cercospora zeina]
MGSRSITCSAHRQTACIAILENLAKQAIRVAGGSQPICGKLQLQFCLGTSLNRDPVVIQIIADGPA